MTKEAKPKSRVSYAKEMRSEASMWLKGLVTISVTLPDGTRHEHQMVADDGECAFAKWAMVMLGREDVRPLPDLEEIIRRVCQRDGITQ